MDEVLIAGAGPTGLALALWLTRQGVKVRIIDKSAGPGETSRAMVVQARTLELYRQLGLDQEVIAAGHITPAINMWARGKHRARLDFQGAGADQTPYNFVLVYPQDRHERLLIDKLAALGIAVERQTELLQLEDDGDRVLAQLRHADGRSETVSTAYLAGCDGARSTVRHQLGTGFQGGTYPQVFYVADVQTSGLLPADEAHIAFDAGDFALVLAYGPHGERRLIGTVRDERAARSATLTFEDVRHDAIERLGLQVQQVNWFSTYHVHHRIADTFQRGRVFLLGDAAHIHSPAGGQGMNTGILDAINLAWKLAHVIQGRATADLLDTYTIERQAFARKLVDTTDRLFTLATSEGNFADFLKTHVVPAVASLAYRFEDTREFLFRTISQTTVHYRDSALSRGRAGAVHGGDRLPWLRIGAGDNHAPLSAIGWQVHVYGQASKALQAWCTRHGVALSVFDWDEHFREHGVARDALYLLRPDTYVALASMDASLADLEHYTHARAHGLHWSALAESAPA